MKEQIQCVHLVIERFRVVVRKLYRLLKVVEATFLSEYKRNRVREKEKERRRIVDKIENAEIKEIEKSERKKERKKRIRRKRKREMEKKIVKRRK